MQQFIVTLIIALSIQVPCLAQTTAVVNGDFALKNVHTGKYVRIRDANTSNGTPIVAYNPVNWKCVTWQFKPSANGGYTLKNLFSGKTLQPQNGDAKAGAAMEEQPIGTTGQQAYELITAGKDVYWVRLKGTELYLTPADAGGATNSSIILQAKQDGDLQQWTLVEQHPTM